MDNDITVLFNKVSDLESKIRSENDPDRRIALIDNMISISDEFITDFKKSGPRKGLLEYQIVDEKQMIADILHLGALEGMRIIEARPTTLELRIKHKKYSDVFEAVKCG